MKFIKLNDYKHELAITHKTIYINTNFIKNITFSQVGNEDYATIIYQNRDELKFMSDLGLFNKLIEDLNK